MLDFVQQLVSGIALGCVYGLIALGFVLVYKATEVVNFAQGDLMMLGGFFAFTFIGMLGLNYWLGFAGAVIAMAAFGMLAERVVVRPILGYPQFSIIMATIGLGYFLRSVVGMIWGTDDFKIETPFSDGVLRIGSLVLAYDKLSVIAATVILCALLYLFFNRTTLGTAMRASSENMLAAYYMGIPVKRVVSIVWAISCGGRDRRRRAAGADHLHSLQCRSRAGPEGVSRRGARRLRLHSRRRGGRRADRRDREHGRLLPAAGLEGRRALHRSSGGAVAQARRPVRYSYAEEGLMRFLFKTDYEDDIRLFPHSGYVVSYGILLAFLVIAPFVLSSYLVSQLVFVCIYATVGVGLMILTGFTGQASLGHAAFLAIGAYTAAYLQQYNVPFPVYFLAGGLLTGVVGALVGFPALRLQGIYLVIATISFAFIVEEVLARWESVTHGNEGMRVKTLSLFGQAVPQNGPTFYFLCLGVLILTIVGTLNLLRSPTGRAFVAIRDSETAARSMGVNVSLYKVKSFAISAAITGLAGVLFAHKLSFISPEMFTLQLSIEFIIVILIGGTFSLHGAVLGAIFLVMIDPFLTYLKDDLPGIISGLAATFGADSVTAGKVHGNVAAIASANGLKGAIYGVIIVLFVLFEPLGLYGRWLKIKLFFQLFPLYKRATFKRQKIYVKSERNR